MLFAKSSSPPPPPLPNTYWVVPWRLLAGEYPYGSDEAEARRRLDRLRDAGIDHFIDLTEIDEQRSYQKLLPPNATYMRSPIPDMCVPDHPAQVRNVLANIRAALAHDRCIYIHCRAGIGRTGLLVGCYLAEQAADGKKGLKRLNRLWRQSARAKTWPTVPQTAEQAEYVRRWPQHQKSPLSPGVDS